MWQHCVVRARTPLEPFKSFEISRWIWKGLATAYPQILSLVLMPNHLHLILPIEVEGGLGKLHGLLGGVSRKVGVERLWQPIPQPAVIPDIFHLRRQVRYVALNPCRKNLCRDPLEWVWSTHREMIGATVHKIDGVADLAKTLKDPRRDFEVRFHSYVSGDPSVNISGTPYPRAVLPGQNAEHSIKEILAAAAAALRVQPSSVLKRGPLRKLFVHLASLHGWKQTSILAEVCGLTPRAVQKILKEPPPVGIPTAQLCLGDVRLRRF